MSVLCFTKTCTSTDTNKTRTSACIAVACTILIISEQSLAEDEFVSIGYSRNSYNFSDSVRDTAGVQSLSAGTSSEGENATHYHAISLPDVGKGHGYGYEFGAQNYGFTYKYDTDDTLTKQITGSVIYFSSLYSYELLKSVRIFAKGGAKFSSSSLSITAADTPSGEGAAHLSGFGFGAGLIISPPSSKFAVLIKYNNFGTVVRNYENDLLVWSSDGRLLSSGNLTLSSLTISLAYKTR